MIVTTGARGFRSSGLSSISELDLLDRRVDQAAAAFALFNLEPETVLGADSLGDGFINRLVDVAKTPSSIRSAMILKRLLFELLGQVADDDRRLER